MSCPDPEFQADFFNNVAAVAMVLIFAKVFANRSRKAEDQGRKPSHRRDRFRASCHALAVLGAATAAVAALLATEHGIDKCIYHRLAWGGLGVVGVIFLLELIVDDVWPHVRPRKKVVMSSATG